MYLCEVIVQFHLITDNNKGTVNTKFTDNIHSQLCELTHALKEFKDVLSHSKHFILQKYQKCSRNIVAR